MSIEKRFTKIKYDGSKVRLEYEQTREQGAPDEFTLQCADAPRPEFGAAMSALRDDVVAICELPEEQALKLTIRGVTLTWSSEIMGACITAMKALKRAHAPLIVNTPHLPSEPYSDEGDPEMCLPVETCARLKVLIEEAERYLNGDRAQGSLLSLPDVAPETHVEYAH